MERSSIQGERRTEHEDSQDEYYRSERSFGSFFRAIPIPEDAEADKADASFRDGVLEITIPARGRDERRRRRPGSERLIYPGPRAIASECGRHREFRGALTLVAHRPFGGTVPLPAMMSPHSGLA